MKIDRSNYEIWLIDLLDGKLNRQEAEMLRLFLNENPDIKAEAEDLEVFALVSTDISIHNKEVLKRTPSGMTNDQFEYLAVAAFEKDVSGTQQHELEEIINNDPARRKVYEQIGRLRLEPGKVIYKHKNRLIRISSAQRVIRMAYMLSGAAAVITLLISLYMLLQEPLPAERTNSAQLVVSPEISNTPSQKSPVSPDFNKPQILAEVKINQSIKPISGTLAVNQRETETVSTDSVSSAERPAENNKAGIKPILISPAFKLSRVPESNRLIACNFPLPNTEDEDIRSSIGRFIARNFREKLLREESPKDTPLKGFEIAEAGVAGINKIFGWEMELDKKKTETGETKSVYFSSRIIKFNAPVKKAEPLASSE